MPKSDKRNIEGGITVKGTELGASNAGKQMEKEIKLRQQKSKLNINLSLIDEKNKKGSCDTFSAEKNSKCLYHVILYNRCNGNTFLVLQ